MDLRRSASHPVASLIAILLALSAPPPARATEAESLVEAFTDDAALRGVTVGVAVAELPDGHILAEHGADRVLFPASGAKLLTVASALRRLDPGTLWTTRVHGDVEGGVVARALVLVGGGDPKLLPGDISALADAVATRGVRSVRGGVIVDATRHDEACLPPAYDEKDTDAGYRASVGAAASNFGAIRVIVRGSKRAGRAVIVSLDPSTDAVEVHNEARTVSGRGEGVSVAASALDDGRTLVTVRGSLGPRRFGLNERLRVADPDLLSGYLLAEALRRRGVTVDGPIRVRRRASEPLPPELARHDSGSLADVVRDTNTWSNNFMAELLFRELGRGPAGEPATWERARGAVTDTLVALGLPREQFQVVNGSGLYHATRISPRAMVQLLVAMAADPEHARTFRESLAIAGTTGTLSHRLRGPATRGRVLAKTGTLDEVVSLSGYLTTRSDRHLAFAVFINEGSPDRTSALRAAIDRLITRLAAL
ncbi:MAG: D-alanyl-D-alanine carboxypeptidase/D-alanyl-D-alanine-endopeptidase [Deltaproteobacteria bacterium]|nr:D-alanyl-D-alanine carboxypeptidase/D-alanyl-D-alanine-endopeptidase [Deltaproteobacteria bacterium]MCB9787265.1 D-alanyl-D-alanine carboxypeptidase/D-alanyl-D-alanine-endopeptidase [Deltaproteobacteria bacterium]